MLGWEQTFYSRIGATLNYGDTITTALRGLKRDLIGESGGNISDEYPLREKLATGSSTRSWVSWRLINTTPRNTRSVCVSAVAGIQRTVMMATKPERSAAQKELDALRLNRAIAKAISGMQPPEDLTVTGWAEAHRRLSAESAAEPGPWRPERTQYLRAPMDAFTDPKVNHIVMVAASQVGKSELMNNAIGDIIDQDPGSILFIQPTTIDVKDYSKLRIAPMIRDCPTLKKRVAASWHSSTLSLPPNPLYGRRICTML